MQGEKVHLMVPFGIELIWWYLIHHNHAIVTTGNFCDTRYPSALHSICILFRYFSGCKHSLISGSSGGGGGGLLVQGCDT